MIQFFNVLTRKKEFFKPLDPNCVKMYVCGPTVYDRIHIGNARAMIVFDIVFRVLKRKFKNVTYVRNLTDIDDKIINKAKQNNIEPNIVAELYADFFFEDMQKLFCLKPDFQPRVTTHMPEIINMIQCLIDNGNAYVVNGEVYFNIKTFSKYGQLSGRKFDFDNLNKEDDFVLWKADSKNTTCLFDSPWGRGRPGWHIECSAMSHKYLGKNFDIHGGGYDLCFPHHENEIAQSCCAYPGSQFANFWLHNNFLTINEDKMSKSLGNFVTVKTLIDKDVKGETIRYALLMTHYRQILNWNANLLTQAKKDLNRFYNALENFEYEHDEVSSEIINALGDDLNVPLVIQELHKIAHKINTDTEKKVYWQNLLKNSANFLGILNYDYEKWFSCIESDKIEELIARRTQAKKEKNYPFADQIRTELQDMGVEISDLQNGEVKWRYIK